MQSAKMIAQKKHKKRANLAFEVVKSNHVNWKDWSIRGAYKGISHVIFNFHSHITIEEREKNLIKRTCDEHEKYMNVY